MVFKEVTLLLDKKNPIPSSFGEIKLQVTKWFIKIHNYNAIQFVSFYYMNKYKMKRSVLSVSWDGECCIFGGLIYRKKGKVKLFCRSRITSTYHILLLDGQMQIIKITNYQNSCKNYCAVSNELMQKDFLSCYQRNIICIKLSMNYSKN